MGKIELIREDVIDNIRAVIPDYQAVDQVLENTYKPLKWAIPFHQSNAFGKMLVGAFGSGKSRSVAEELLQLGLEYPGGESLISRWTLPDLKQTAMKTLLSVIPTGLIKNFNKTDKELYLLNSHKFLFKGLKDDVENPEKLKSYEYNFAWIEEASELERSIFNIIIQRARKGLKPKNRHCCIFSFNPTNEQHWLYDVCVKNPLQGFEVFKSRTVDNIQNLPPMYIDNLKTIYPKEQWPQVLEGEFGNIRSELGVFSSDFKKDLHCRTLSVDKSCVLRRTWDWGFNHPSCIVFQVTPNGQFRSIKEFFGTNIFLKEFAAQVLDYCASHFGDVRVVDFGDPHGNDKKDDGLPSIQLLRNEFNIVVQSRRTEIMEGITLMRRKLNTLSGGEPGWVIDPDGCPVLYSGLNGGYKMDPKTNKPIKEGYYEHAFDAMRYGFVNSAYSDMKQVSNLKKRYYNPSERLTSFKTHNF